jgi:hypothetical protein
MADAPQDSRNRAVWTVRLVTSGAVAGALAVTWAFSNMAEAFFSGKPQVAIPPQVPALATPVQQARPVITKIVHHPAGSRPGAAAPRAPGAAPAPAPAPPPAPACHSTPSKPC